MIRKQLDDGTWVEEVNSLTQTARTNLTDMIMGFFNGSTLSKDEVRQVVNDVLEYVSNNENDYLIDAAVPITIQVSEEVTESKLSACFMYGCIADTILTELGDTEFARQVYLRSEELAVTIDDFECLANSIRRNLHDNSWYKRLRAKAKVMKQIDNEDTV